MAGIDKGLEVLEVAGAGVDCGGQWIVTYFVFFQIYKIINILIIRSKRNLKYNINE